MDDKKIIYEFIGVNQVGTVCTVDLQNHPHAAIVDLVVLENLHLLFSTYTTSRKYKNLKENPFVSVVVWDGGKIQVQYEGIAAELTGGEYEKHKSTYDEKASWRIWKIREFRLFKIAPIFIRFSDFTSFPEKVIEVKL